MQSEELPYRSHGLLLLDDVLSRGGDDAGVLCALHGYAMTAAAMADRTRPLADLLQMPLACPEAPHLFYKGSEVVGSWMTSHRREQLIIQNEQWLVQVYQRLCHRTSGPIVLFGYSQGASQLWRCLAFLVRCLSAPNGDTAGADGSLRLPAAAMFCGGDLPPDLPADLPPALLQQVPLLLLRGERDRWYTETRWQQDQQRLQEWYGLQPELRQLDAGHELTDSHWQAMAAWWDAQAKP